MNRDKTTKKDKRGIFSEQVDKMKKKEGTIDNKIGGSA